jgi:hypothetical protein
MLFGPVKTTKDGRYYLRTTGEGVRKNFKKVNVSMPDGTVDFGGWDLKDEIVSNALENREAWFGKKLSDKVVQNAYIPSGNCIQVNTTNCRIYNHKKELINEPEYSGLADVCLEHVGLSFSQKNYQSVWRLVQVKKCKPPPVVEEFLFSDSESSDDDGVF